MNIKNFIYWVIFLVVTVGTVVYMWPGATPTYKQPLWLPSTPSDPSLAAAWLQNPGESVAFEYFQGRKFLSSWSFITPLKHIANAPANWPLLLIHLGKDDRGKIQSTSLTIGGILGIMPWPESWLRPIEVDTVEIDPTGFLVIKTRPDWLYPVKAFFIGMGLGLILVLLMIWKFGAESCIYVRWPIAHRPSEPEKPKEETLATTIPNPKTSEPEAKGDASGKKGKRRKKPAD